MKTIAFALFMFTTLQVFSAEIKADNKNVNDVTLNDKTKTFLFDPIIKQKDDYVRLGLTNPEKENVDIIVKDVFGYELLNIQNQDDYFIKKTFDVSQLPQGDYTIEVIANDITFTKVITIK